MKKLIVFAVFVIMFGACSGVSNLVQKSDSNSNGGAVSGNNPAVTAGANPREELLTASKKFTETQSFRATMDGSGSQNIHIELDFIAPDRYHLRNAPSMESIIIGKDTYMKTGGGAWRKFPGSLSESIPKMRDAFTEEALKTLKEVEYVGEDTVNGKSAFVYRYQGDTIKDVTQYISKLWVGKENGLPLKIEVEYPNGDILKNMTTVYDYDAKITIEPPTEK